MFSLFMLESLSRRDSRWDAGSWIFRGHADASWDLLPGALRTPCPITHHPRRPSKKPYETTVDQLEQEVDAVWRFVTNADYHGLPIPGDAGRVLRLMDRDRFEFKKVLDTLERFPSEETEEAYALAQHHGVPTRLLDWSRNPLVGVYFAAEGAAKAMENRVPADRLGIWCYCWDSFSPIAGQEGEDIHLVSPPRAENKNLLAQNGLFTLHVHPLMPQDPPVIERFDELVLRLFNLNKGVDRFQGKGPIRLLTLPTSQARLLLNLLKQEDVSAASLFPGYDGIVRDISEGSYLRQSWRCPPETGLPQSGRKKTEVEFKEL